MRRYRIVSSYFCIHDGGRERLLFHVLEGDYFPFLATIIGMLGAGTEDDRLREVAEESRQDLLYLHERFLLVPREKPLSYTRQKVVRFAHEHPRINQSGH